MNGLNRIPFDAAPFAWAPSKFRDLVEVPQLALRKRRAKNETIEDEAAMVQEKKYLFSIRSQRCNSDTFKKWQNEWFGNCTVLFK